MNSDPSSSKVLVSRLKLHCQTINRKCVLDRHASVKTVVFYGSVDTMRNNVHVPDCLASQSFQTFFKINVKL